MEGLFTHVRDHVASGWTWLWSELPMLAAAFRRFHRLNRRFDAIVARHHAGALPQARGVAVRGRTAERRPSVLPHRRGWALTISFAVLRSYELQEMLEDPETAASVAAIPQLGSIYRPLCHMLNVKEPAWLRLPNRRIPKPPKPKRILVRLGAGQLWRGPTVMWPREADAKKFDAKIWIYPHELEERPQRSGKATKPRKPRQRPQPHCGYEITLKVSFSLT
jgi:hypothetical protein